MPEGHVIHRLARRLNSDFRPHEVAVTSPQGRFAASAALIDGHPIASAEALGKHLFVHFGNARILYVHLGLIGSLRFEPVADVWGQIRVRIVDGAGTLAANLRGPQACRLLDPGDYERIVRDAGQDPLRGDADPGQLWPRIAKTRRSIGALLMDQKFFAGVGNIYRAETLFRLGLSPFIPGNQLSVEQFESIWADLVSIMAVGVETGRIDTVRDEHLPENMGRDARVDDHGGEVYVYRRQGQPCYLCGTEIVHQVMQGRNLFYCPSCQA